MTAQLAWVPGAAQVLMYAIWECRDAPRCTGLQDVRSAQPVRLDSAPIGVWWRWRVPGQGEPLDLVAEEWALLRNRIRQSLR